MILVTILLIIIGAWLALIFWSARGIRRDAEMGEMGEMGELLARFLSKPITAKQVADEARAQRGEIPPPGTKEVLREFDEWLASEGIENEKRARLVKQCAKILAKKGFATEVEAKAVKAPKPPAEPMNASRILAICLALFFLFGWAYLIWSHMPS